MFPVSYAFTMLSKLITIYNHYICFPSHMDIWSFRILKWEQGGRAPTCLLGTIIHISEREAYLMVAIFWLRRIPPIHHGEDKHQRCLPHLREPSACLLIQAILESKFPCSLEETLPKERTIGMHYHTSNITQQLPLFAYPTKQWNSSGIKCRRTQT